jgi:hypothetical protein
MITRFDLEVNLEKIAKEVSLKTFDSESEVI